MKADLQLGTAPMLGDKPPDAMHVPTMCLNTRPKTLLSIDGQPIEG
jgi:hypothetical protein